jgi:fermentation-respiration switch protein FrsA (DUF1100 family)
MKRVVCVTSALGLLLLGAAGLAHGQDAEAPAAQPSAVEAPAVKPPTVPAQPSVPAGPPTIAEFLAEPIIEDVALAPGGGHFAFVHRQDDISYLVVRDLNAPDAKPVIRRLGEVRVYGLEWINDERLIYSAGSNEVGVDYKRGRLTFTGVPRLFASNRDLQDTLVFFKDDKKIESSNVITASDVMLLANDPEHFLIPLRVGRNLDLVKVNVRDGKWSTAASGAERTMAWYVDSFGLPVMRFDTNRRFTEVQVMIPQRREQNRYDWKQAFALRFDRMSERAPDFMPIAPGPQPGLYYVIGRPAGADRSGVWLYNLETQKYATEVFTHPRVDVEGGIIDPRDGVYVGATFWNDMLDASFIEGKMQAHFNGLKEFFENERNVTFVDRSADQQVWVLATSGPRDPGTYHIYNMGKAHNEVIGVVNPRLSPDRLGKTEPITYKARDGVEISGYLTLPPKLAEGAAPPLIVYPHGGPEVRTKLSFDIVAQFLATRGYAVFQPNFRGSAGYGKAFVDSGNRQFAGTMQTDITDGVMQLVEQGRVDGSRICIMGESYGGYAALMGAVQSSDLYRCAVSAAGVSDLYRQVRWERDEEGRNSEAYKYWVTKIGDPDRDKAAMNAASPINNLDAIRIPVMLMHGKQDDTVPFEQSDLMQQALRKAGKTQKFVIFENAGHTFTGSNLEAYLTQLEQFFATHLPP